MTTYMTDQEIRELKRMCADPFLELGMTLRPKHLKCFEPHIVTSSVALMIHFKDHEVARDWNLMHEKRIRRSGHMATVALSLLVGMVGGGLTRSAMVGATSSIIKDELQAKVWYPKVAKGWTLTRTYFFNYQQFPSQNFTMRWTDLIRDENDREYEKRSYDVYRLEVGGPSGIPKEVVRNIMTRFPQYKYIEFAPLNTNDTKNR